MNVKFKKKQEYVLKNAGDIYLTDFILNNRIMLYSVKKASSSLKSYNKIQAVLINTHTHN